MKALLFVMTLAVSLNTFARKIDREAMAEVRGCSSYLFASAEQHHASAATNFRTAAAEACWEKGYTSWSVLNYTTSPGLNVPVYCFNGHVACE
ncbi:hypothetical protein [Bdellovibrio sp.]|uniref:hypothetical protein n=1 Tax=Bdellovibrio sp. TaxID=28201 RepID=UPI0039E255F3